MVGYKKPRDSASVALIQLREKMGKTQAQFAVEVLKTAVTTVARYETSHRPPGDVLLRLRDIAREQGQMGLADQFQSVWLQDVDKALGPVKTFTAADGHGLLVSSLDGELQLRGATVFLHWLGQINSPDPGIKKRALAALKHFETEVEDPAHKETHDAFRSLMAPKKGKTR